MSPILGIFASGANVAAGAFESIATATGTGSSGTITFSSIPGTYQHLQIRYISKSTTNTINAVYGFSIRFNSDTGSNYARHALRGVGTTVDAGSAISQTSLLGYGGYIPSSGAALTNMHGVGIIDIHDYASTSKNKTIRSIFASDVNRTTTPVGQVVLYSGLWFATPAAITSIDLILDDGNWTTTSQFALYGVKGA